MSKGSPTAKLCKAPLQPKQMYRNKREKTLISKMMARLRPAELRELLSAVVEFLAHPAVLCRERMYAILMWVHDNYR